MTTERRRFAVGTALLSFLALAVVSSGAGAFEGGDAPCRKELRRIEAAFMAGFGRAETPLESYECLRVRNAELRLLLEHSYAATLVWLAGRRDMVDALERDQARWLSDLASAEAIWGRSITDSIASQAVVSTMLLERLRLFAAIAGGPPFTEGAD